MRRGVQVSMEGPDFQKICACGNDLFKVYWDSFCASNPPLTPAIMECSKCGVQYALIMRVEFYADQISRDRMVEVKPLFPEEEDVSG
jgi:hypothetical protein